MDGYLFLDKAKFRASFAADVSEAKAAFLADSQVPWGLNALSGSISAPAWRTKPSWYLVATEDKMIPPPAQRQMATRAGATVAEAAGSHAIYISKPEAVAALIDKAAKSVSAKTSGQLRRPKFATGRYPKAGGRGARTMLRYCNDSPGDGEALKAC